MVWEVLMDYELYKGLYYGLRRTVRKMIVQNHGIQEI